MSSSGPLSASPIGMPETVSRSVHLGAAMAMAAIVSGCASFSSDGGLSVTSGIAAQELKKDVIAIRSPEDTMRARARIDDLLRRPLTADAAVQIALLNNRGLQAVYNELGIAEAAMVQASLPPNPSFSFSRIAGPLEYDIEAAVAADILALVTMPARSEIAADRFRAAQFRAAGETLRVAAETRRNYYRAVAAQELTGFLKEANAAAEAAAKVAGELGATGAMNKLDQARDQVFYAEVTAQLAAARQRAASERERLIRSLGVWGNDLGFKLPVTLPALPQHLQPMPTLERDALNRRIDLQIARLELEALTKSYGLTNATRYVNLCQLSGLYKDEKENVPGEKVDFKDFGAGATVEIPVFDLGEVRVRQAEQSYMRGLNLLAEKAVNVRSEARDAYRTYRSAYDIASHYQRKILPLRKIISDETLLRYNGMLIDVFTLLAEARQRILSTMAAIDAKRDFWMAETGLQVAIVGGGTSGLIDGKPEAGAPSDTTIDVQAANSGERP